MTLLLKTLEQRQCSHLYWSPSGGHIVLSGQGDYNGALEFYDVDALLEKGVTSDHYRCRTSPKPEPEPEPGHGPHHNHNSIITNRNNTDL